MSNLLKQLLARDVMNEGIQWADSTENLRTAGNRMAKHRIRTLLVRGQDEHDLPGILSSKDVVNMVGAHDLSVLDELHVEDACTRPAICVPETTHLLDCINLMRMAGVRRMPVLREGTVVGILSLSDVFDRIMKN
ncbi:MAG: CBS domain containing-hemolysin-like protein [Neolewinella sp.]|jgi:CBS domain containing-hemolysin-like protein